MSRKNIPFGFIDGNEIYLKGSSGMPDRMIGVVKENEAKSIQYFVDRFEVIASKVDQLENNISNAINKGSFLMKLIHLRDKLQKYNGLGDYAPLFDRLDKMKVELESVIVANKIRNEKIKESLSREFEKFQRITDWKQATNEILQLRDKWLRIGPARDKKNAELEELFSTKMQEFFDRKRAYADRIEKETETRLNKMKEMVEEVRKINPNAPGFNLKREAERLRSNWRAIGPVAFTDRKHLEKNFNSEISKLFKSRERISASAEEMEQNLIRKKALIAKAIELEKSDSLLQLQELQKEWKKIGLVHREAYRDTTEEFKSICEKAFEKRLLEQLAHNKDDSYDSKNNREKTRFKIILLKDLLKQDEIDLQTFTESMSRHSSDQKYDKALNNKLLNQKRKVFVKKQLLSELKKSLNDITIKR